MAQLGIVRERLRGALVCALSGLLFACAGGQVVDGPPDWGDEPTKLPGNAVPKAEPRSKYGNPRSYVVHGKRYYVMGSSLGYVERGIASWYGKKFHGRRTSNGETYDMHGMTAAHKTLPLPTYVRVTNLDNERSVVLRVNDRGPFHGNRIIDLSYSAARALGIVRNGTGYVEVRALQPGTRVATAPAPSLRKAANESPRRTTKPLNIYLQVGAFALEANAIRLHDRLQALIGPMASVTPGSSAAGRRVYRVRLGPLADVAHVDRLTDSLVEMGIELPQVVLE